MASTLTASDSALESACVHEATTTQSPHSPSDCQGPTTTPWVGVRRAVPAVGFIGVCAAAAFTELSAEEGQVFCPYRLITGGWCPGCGCTRALKALVRGDISDSLTMNPWTLVLFVQAFVASIALLVLPERTVSWVKKNQLRIAVFNLIFGVGVWSLRLAWGVIPLPFT